MTDVAGNAANFAGANSTFPSLTVNASPTSVTTLNANGTIHDIHYYGIAGQAYTDYDVVYGANNKAASATLLQRHDRNAHVQRGQHAARSHLPGRHRTEIHLDGHGLRRQQRAGERSVVERLDGGPDRNLERQRHDQRCPLLRVTGQAYTDYDVVYGANNKAAEATYSNGMTETLTYNSANTLQEVIYQGVTGQKYTSIDTVYGANTRRRAKCGRTARRSSRPKPGMPTARSNDVHYYGITGQAYTDYDVVYGANNKAAEAIYSNGMTDTYTYNSDGTLQEQDYQGVTGQKYTSMDTVYGANNTPASESVVNGSTVVQTETWNANGTINDIHYYGITGSLHRLRRRLWRQQQGGEAIYSNGMTETLTYNSANTLQEVIYRASPDRNIPRWTRSTASTTRRRAKCGQTARPSSRPKPGTPTARSTISTITGSPARPTPITTSSTAPTTSRRRRSTPTA